LSYDNLQDVLLPVGPRASKWGSLKLGDKIHDISYHFFRTVQQRVLRPKKTSKTKKNESNESKKKSEAEKKKSNDEKKKKGEESNDENKEGNESNDNYIVLEDGSVIEVELHEEKLLV